MEEIYKVVDVETGNYCIYEGGNIIDAYESIRDNAKISDCYGDEYGDDFVDAELWDLYCNDERIWCGKTDTLLELVDKIYEDTAFDKKAKDYLYAVWCWGSDPQYIETEEDAITVFLLFNDDFEYQEQLSLDNAYDCKCTWEKLDLTDEKPTKIYCGYNFNSEAALICFEEDYLKNEWPAPYQYDWDEEDVYLLPTKEGLPNPLQVEGNIGAYPVTAKLLELITPEEIISLGEGKQGELCCDKDNGWYIVE